MHIKGKETMLNYIEEIPLSLTFLGKEYLCIYFTILLN